MYSPAPTSKLHCQEGFARLRFERVGDITRLTRADTQPPLAVMRVLHLDEAMPDLAVAFLINSTAGVFQGDHLSTEVLAASEARVHLTTPSATKVFSMPEGEACMSTRLTVEPGALLEYLPDPLIPFAGARLTQAMAISVYPGGTLLYGDVLTPGRTGMGETLAYRQYRQRLTVDDGAGNLLYHEAFDLRPTEQPLPRLGVMGRDSTALLGTMVAVVPQGADRLLDAVRSAPVMHGGVSAAAGMLAGGTGIAVRLLAPETAAVRAGMRAVWTAFRSTQYGMPVTDLRKN